MAFKASGAIRPINVSTAGVHPLVKKSMLPRMKASKQSGVVAQSNMMRAIARGVKMQPTNGGGNLMSKVERSSRRNMVGRRPIA